MEKIYIKLDEKGKIKAKIADMLKNCLDAEILLLKKVKKEYPDKYNLFIKSIFSDIKELIKFNKLINSEVINLLSYEYLKDKPELFKRSVSTALKFLNFSKYEDQPLEEEIEVDMIDFVKLYDFFEYYLANSLLSIMSGEELIDFYKKFNDEVTISRRDPKNYYESLEEVMKFFDRIIRANQNQDVIMCLEEKGKFILKVERCKWAEVLKDLNPEISYAMLCYADFERAKNYNPNFTLTRTKTIMQGNDFCDFCYHDTRVHKEIKHPAPDYWKNLD